MQDEQGSQWQPAGGLAEMAAWEGFGVAYQGEVQVGSGKAHDVRGSVRRCDSNRMRKNDALGVECT